LAKKFASCVSKRDSKSKKRFHFTQIMCSWSLFRLAHTLSVCVFFLLSIVVENNIILQVCEVQGGAEKIPLLSPLTSQSQRDYMKKQGYIKLHRKILESEIWVQEPWRLKAWLYMLLQANHSGIKKFGQKLERGQLLVNRITDFNKEIRWKRGFVYKTPTVEATKTLWRWLRERAMVTTKRTTRGTIITISNYCLYQDRDPKETNSVATSVATKQQPSNNQAPLTIDKNDKECKECKEEPQAKQVLQNEVKPLNEILELFRSVNPSYKMLFVNKTERSALTRLINQHGLEKIEWLLEVLPKTNAMPYSPTITTPFMLEKKLGDLIAFMKKKQFSQNKVIKI